MQKRRWTAKAENGILVNGGEKERKLIKKAGDGKKRKWAGANVAHVATKPECSSKLVTGTIGKTRGGWERLHEQGKRQK